MGRTARDNRDRYRPRPVERITLNGEHLRGRLIAVVVLLVFGAGMLAYAFLQLVTPDSEWIAVEAGADQGPTCGNEFVLLYRPGGGGISPAAERKAVTILYTRLCREAYQQFSCREGFEGVGNLYDLNHRPNEALEVGAGLYAALEAVVHSGSRVLYLGPVYERYRGVFTCLDDAQLADFDPRLSEDVAREYQEAAAYARDPATIDLELLGENRVRLNVSADCLAWAEREGVEIFLDFSWMTNAFIADFIADGLIAQGYTHGALTSYDGFSRNLDGQEVSYSLTLYSRQGETVYPAAVLDYQGPMAFVSLRDYPVGEMDALRFYTLRSGERRTPYLDVRDGLCRNALPELVCYSPNRGCGAILLDMLPVYIADGFRPEEVAKLERNGVQSVYCDGFTLHFSGAGANVRDVYETDGVKFEADTFD